MSTVISYANGSDWIPIEPKQPNPWIYEESEIQDARPFLPTVILKIVGLAKDLFVCLKRLYYKHAEKNRYSNAIEQTDESPKKALVVLLHGLHAHPAQMRSHRVALEALHGDSLAYFQPAVKAKGDCSLDEASLSIHDAILSWAKQNPDIPIIFSGVSNGARISAHVAHKLKCEDQVSNAIKVNAIAGPFFGSKMVNQPDLPGFAQKAWRWILSFNHSDAILDELAWDSGRSKEVIEEVRQAADEGVDFNFYSTYADGMVNSHTSAMPKGVKNGIYKVYQYEGHSSIVEAVKSQVVESVN